MNTIFSQWSAETNVCPWNTTFGTWETEAGEIVARSACRLECVLPEGGAKRVRIVMETLQASQRVLLELDDAFFHFGAGTRPGFHIELANRVRASTTRESIGANATDWCETDGEMLRMGREETSVLETPNPYGSLPVRALALHLPEGTRFRALRVEVESLASPRTPTPKQTGLKLAGCIDFYDDLIANPWTTETFRECMAIHRKHQVRRIDFIDHFGQAGGFWRNAGYPAYSQSLQDNINQTFENVGDFLPAAVAAAKAEGLEIFAVVKPFETGMCGSVPVPPSDGSPAFRSLGGWNLWTTNFTAQNPHLRMERDPRDVVADLAQRRVGEIVLQAEAEPRHALNPKQLRLWQSTDNGTYAEVNLSASQVVISPDDSCKIILSDLDLGGPYFAVTWESAGPAVFGHRIGELVELYDTEGRRLPHTLSTLQNPPARDFTRGGFAWDASGSEKSLFWLDGGRPLGIAVGVERYLQGALCPAYPEVRAWWLEQIQACLAAGVDGIDLRVCSHHRTFHPEAYGFNPPVVAAFQDRYGIDIRTENFNRRDLRILLGEFYSDFVREARKMVHAAGKRLHLHLELGFQEPEFHPDLEIYFDWRRWLDEGLADGVGVKGGRCMQSPLSQEFAAHARACGVTQVDFNPSLNILTGHPDPQAFMRYVLDDTLGGGADGLILYENAVFMAARPDGSLEIKTPWLLEMAAGEAVRK